MIFFNYSAIYLLSKGDSTLIIKYLQAMVRGRYPNLKGLNYLRNTSILFSSNFTDRQKAEFVGICSLRPYSDYKLHKETKLHISRIPPWVSKSIVKTNPLIEIKQPYLIFKTEE